MTLRKLIKEIKKETRVNKIKELNGCSLYKNSKDYYSINSETSLNQIYKYLKKDYIFIPF